MPPPYNYVLIYNPPDSSYINLRYRLNNIIIWHKHKDYRCPNLNKIIDVLSLCNVILILFQSHSESKPIHKLFIFSLFI